MSRSHLMRLLAYVVSALQFGSASIAAPSTRYDPNPVPFAFKWSPGVRAVAHLTLTEQPPDAPAHIARFAATMLVEKRDANLLISFVEPKVDADLSSSPTWRIEALNFVTVPDFLVSTEGRFFGLSPRQHIRDALHETFGNSGTQPLGPKEIDQLAPLAEARARRLWVDWAALWLGASVAPDTVYEMKRNIPLYLYFPFPAHSEFLIVGKETCQRGGQKAACVRIRMTDTALPEDLAAWRQQMYSHAPDRSKEELKSEMESQDIKFLGTTTILVEPNGIFPHAISSKRTLDITGTRDGHPRSERIVWDLESEWQYE